MSEEAKPNPFDTADYYDCGDSPERLSHESVEEAIENYIDGWVPSADLEEQIRENCPIRVTAYERLKIERKVLVGSATAMLERFYDHYAEEYGDPDESVPFGKDDRMVAREEIADALKKLCDTTSVWRCDPVATRDYSAEEVLAMMKDANPSWFAKGAGGDG